jgi:hypothetical protein
MESKPNFNFSQYSLSKPSKGHWVRNIIFFAVIIILISLIYWLLTKQVKKITPKTQQIELIENVKIEIDTANR